MLVCGALVKLEAWRTDWISYPLHTHFINFYVKCHIMVIIVRYTHRYMQKQGICAVTVSKKHHTGHETWRTELDIQSVSVHNLLITAAGAIHISADTIVVTLSYIPPGRSSWSCIWHFSHFVYPNLQWPGVCVHCKYGCINGPKYSRFKNSIYYFLNFFLGVQRGKKNQCIGEVRNSLFQINHNVNKCSLTNVRKHLFYVRLGVYYCTVNFYALYNYKSTALWCWPKYGIYMDALMAVVKTYMDIVCTVQLSGRFNLAAEPCAAYSARHTGMIIWIRLRLPLRRYMQVYGRSRAFAL